MRRVALAIATVTVASGLAACTSGPAEPGATTPPPTTAAAADDTAADDTAVCDEALSTNSSKSILLQGKFTELQAAQQDGDTAKVTELAAEAQTEVTDWAAKLTELSNQSIKPEVKTALTDAASALSSIGPDSDPTETQTKLLGLISNISTVCG